MTLEQLHQHIKDLEQATKTCIGSGCLDEAATAISLMAYVGYLVAKKKQEAYALSVTEMAKGESAAKSDTIMKASDEYKEFLILQSYHESLLEHARNLRAKGKGDDIEKQLS